MGLLTRHLVVVLHQTRSVDNLGAVARVMVNFGFDRLSVSEPHTYAFRAAQKLAVGGEPLLETLELHQSLADALSAAVYACGTSSRRRVQGRPLLSPEEAVAKLAAEARRGPVALVFGGEKRGLSDAELSLCQDIAVIPTSSAQPSMNLSHALAVLLYLCARQGDGDLPSEEAPPLPGARIATNQALLRSMRAVLLECGFLNRQGPDLILGEIHRSLLRGSLSQREAEIWLSAFRHVERALKEL